MKHSLGLAVLMLLGACAESVPAPDVGPVLTPAPEDAPEALSPKPAFVDALSSVADPLPDPLPDPMPDPGRLIGLSPAEVQEMLSPVSLIRRMDSAQVIQFVNEDCVLDIYFYETAPGEGFAANHVTARDRAGGSVDSADCLRALLSAEAWPEGAAARLMPAPEPDPT